MSWLVYPMWWYVVTLLLGLVTVPMTAKLFRRFTLDKGYVFARTLSLLIVSYGIFVLSTIHFLTFSTGSLLILAGALLCANVVLYKKISFTKSQITLIIFEEICFLLFFLLWVFVRGQEPSIRGLEKFMDYGFINAILRSPFMPPPDIWYAGSAINYYYFGHLSGAVLIKLSGVPPPIAYNLILATLFSLAVTHTFSLVANAVNIAYKSVRGSIFGGILASLIVNFGGNLHTIYVFTKGYSVENPAPFWKILAGFNPAGYWYPNATRFIPFTIHEFPLYSYVVADLHGHVFDIPFVLITLAILLTLFASLAPEKESDAPTHTTPFTVALLRVGLLGSLAAIHYMTNAFDGPIYALLIVAALLIYFGLTKRFVLSMFVLVFTFIVVALPFTAHFSPFVSGIGVNCAPQFLVAMEKFGPFLFEKDKCQTSALWMMALLWGFFLIHFGFLALAIFKIKRKVSLGQYLRRHPIHLFFLLCMSFGLFLIAVPELFYIKDIYPAHFRANTMFKMGYQAFIIMGAASAFTFIVMKQHLHTIRLISTTYFFIFIPIFFLIIIYPRFAIVSYYGDLKKTPQLDGSVWLSDTHPAYKEVIEYFQTKIKGQPVILEAQGDSYTDYNLVSSYTGLPTVAGWWVHEWLWRGTSEAVGDRIPDLQTVYESEDIEATLRVIDKYKIEYIIVGPHEKEKYPSLKEEKFSTLGRLIFESSEGVAKIYHTTYRP